MRFWAWGANNADQLGLGFKSEQVSVPTEVNISNVNVLEIPIPNNTKSGHQFLSIAGGGCHTLILGINRNKKNEPSNQTVSILNHLGHTSSKQEIQQEQSFPSIFETGGESDVQQISCGWDFNIFLDSFGKIHTCGENTFGQLGRKFPTKFPEINHQVQVPNKNLRNFEPAEFESKIEFVSVSAGLRHAAAIGCNCNQNGDFELYTWGDNSKGQLGHDSSLNSKIIPNPIRVKLDFTNLVNIASVPKPVRVRCSKYTTIFQADTGDFYAAGLNKFGIFGNAVSGNETTVSRFVRLTFLKLEYKSVKDFQCGWNHVLILLENGQVLSWGRNNFGQLGRKTDERIAEGFDCIPGLVEGLFEPIISIKCGTEHNLALGKSGKLYSWGWNEHDNCGVKGGDNQFIPTPTVVPFLETEKVILIGCGAGTGFAVSESQSR